MKKTPAKKKPRQRTPREALRRYQAKRDFSKSPEPSGAEKRRAPSTARAAVASSAKSPKRAVVPKITNKLAYCVQKHDASHLHYDFRLEHPKTGTLLSWAVPKGPSLNPRDKRLAMRVEDHPFDYRTFEGIIPSGYGAGVVMLWDEGTWSPEEGFENVGAALRKGELKFRLEGVKLKGSWVLVRTGEATPTGEREKWLLIKHRDAWAGDIIVTEVASRSIRSDRDLEAIRNAPVKKTWASKGRPGS